SRRRHTRSKRDWSSDVCSSDLDPDGPHAPPNEIWASSTSDPEGDLIANDEGVAVGSGSADWIARQQPLSIMIHEPELPGLPIACAELSGYTAPATLVLAADDGEGSGVELLEYRSEERRV